MIKYAHVFDMRFIGRVLHNVTFHDNVLRFSDVHGLPRDVEEIMQITCPAFHVLPILSKFALTNSYMLDIFKFVSLRYPVLGPRSVRWAVSKIETHTQGENCTQNRHLKQAT